MKRLIILIEAIIIAVLLYFTFAVPQVEAVEEVDYFIMTVTAYTIHPDCISDKWNDGFTATMTPIREGVVAINVDLVNGKWKVRSPLKLGQKIYIEGMGNYSVEDTGRFAERNEQQDIWTVDVYVKSLEEAKEIGREVKKVYVLEVN